MQKKEKVLMEKAISSKNLSGRADCNRIYGTKDFNSWVAELIDNLIFESVLDVCCGTGNQLVLYASRPEITHMVGVDISNESIRVAKERLLKIDSYGNINLQNMSMEDMPNEPEINDDMFDLISCFYGLYYSQNVSETLNWMIDHVSENGTILIVGPYGDNNKSLFDLLSKYFDLPDFVIHSSKSFMELEVLPILDKKCKIKTEYFCNEIRYPDAKSLIDYWKASTFYFPEYEDALIDDIEEYFSSQKEFVVEKHVMACTAMKVK